MAEDREVLRSIWDGRLPVCFNLSSDEVVTVEQPDPYYVSISIFPAVLVNLEGCRRLLLKGTFEHAEYPRRLQQYVSSILFVLS